MRVRIVRPLPASLEGVDLDPFKFGADYEIKAPLCDLLVALGYAVPADFLEPVDQKPTRRRKKLLTHTESDPFR